MIYRCKVGKLVLKLYKALTGMQQLLIELQADPLIDLQTDLQIDLQTDPQGQLVRRYQRVTLIYSLPRSNVMMLSQCLKIGPKIS